MGVKAVYNTDRPEAHDILRRWRAISDGYEPARLLIGETNVDQLPTLMEFYGNGRDELHGGFNFVFLNAALEAAAMRAIVEDVEATLPPGAWPIWTGSNHDVSRLATRWAAGDPAKVRCALLILLTLRGTPFLYQGDEIGLTDGPIEQSDLRDSGRHPLLAVLQGTRRRADADALVECAGRRVHRGRAWRRGSPWPTRRSATWPTKTTTPTRCWPSPGVPSPGAPRATTWPSARYRSLPSPPGTWVFERGSQNRRRPRTCRRPPQEFDGLDGSIILATDRAREGSAVMDGLTLAPWSGVVVRR